MTTNGLFQVVESGNGFQIVNPGGVVIAWAVDLAWAALIAQGLERQLAEMAGEIFFEKSFLSL